MIEFADQLPVPYCFVLPAPATAELPPNTSNQDYQTVTEKFLTILAVDNSATEMQININSLDAQKHFYNFDKILAYRQEIFNSILGWSPVSNMNIRKVRFVGSTPLEITEGRIYHQLEWEIKYDVCMKTAVDPEELLKKILYAYVPIGEDGSVAPEDYIEVFHPDTIAGIAEEE